MQVCSQCQTEVKEVNGVLRPVNDKLNCDRATFIIPFGCPVCNAINVRYRAIRDVVFLFPTPKPTIINGIHVPDFDFGAGGKRNTQEELRDPTAIVLSIGYGAYTPKGKFISSDELEVGDIVYYNKRVPWRMEHKSPDGVVHEMVICGYQDISSKVTEDVEVMA
jgi:hypothetical protein